VVAYLALGLALSGTASAATGNTFLLGRSNAAARPSTLANTGTGPALVLHAKPSSPPLRVGRNGTKVPYLNADRLDGRHAGAFQRRVTGTCTGGTAITRVRAGGRVDCTAPPVPPMWAVVDAGGNLVRSTSGVSVAHSGPGSFVVTFPRDVSSCAYTATVGLSTSDVPPRAFATTAPSASSNDGVLVVTYVSGQTTFGIADAPFHLLVVC
jgi:hypothetical protein